VSVDVIGYLTKDSNRRLKFEQVRTKRANFVKISEVYYLPHNDVWQTSDANIVVPVQLLPEFITKLQNVLVAE